MKNLVLVLTGVTLASACSNGREQRAPDTNRVAQQADLTLPDTATRRDTSLTTFASGSGQRVSPVEQNAPQPARPHRAKTIRKSSHRPRPAAPARAKKAQEDTATVQAYAPGATRDTAVPAPTRDNADTAAVDSTATPGDTLESPDSSRVAADTNRAAVDSTRMAADSTGMVADSTRVAASRPDSAGAAADTLGDSTVFSSATTNASKTTNVAARTLPIGTEIHAALDDSITSRRDTVGQLVPGHVMENVRGVDGRTLIAAGTPVRFTITQIRPSRSKGSQGRLVLEAQALALGGQPLPLKADIRNVPRELRGRGVTASEAAKVGGGAAAGAVIGGVVGKTKGAVIGGVAGAAAGAVVASQTATRDVVVKAKTPVLLVLTAPLVAP